MAGGPLPIVFSLSPQPSPTRMTSPERVSEPLANAPRGKHILAKVRCFSSVPHPPFWRESGFKWVEVWFNDGKWRLWCGNDRTWSTENVNAVDWIELDVLNKEAEHG